MKQLIKWVGMALSEKGVPSSKRLFGFLFVLSMCYGIIYKVHVSHDLPKYLLYSVLAVICLLAGVATVPQLIQLYRGDKPSPKEDKTDLN